MAGRSVVQVVKQVEGMARRDQAVVRTRPARRQARMVVTLGAQAVRGQRAVPRAPMVDTAARMAARMAAGQHHQQVRHLLAALTPRIPHRAAQVAGCGHNSFIKK